MFSPDSTVHSVRSSSTRNPRRRQRDSDSLRQPPNRKRSKLSEESFVPVSSSHINGNGSALMNGRAVHGEVDGSLVVVDMPVREKKPVAKRPSKEDEGILLTKSENYSVRRLPNFPVRLRDDRVPFRAFAFPSSGHGLALTSEHAIAWDYTSVTGPTKLRMLPLPFGLRPSDPLPLGAVVRNGPSNDFGIIAVAPSTGKITFWENVDTAEARSHFPQRHQGVNGSVGRMAAGETITDIVDIEHAGYILIYSTGRLAQLTLRDSQGRPNITVHPLQAPSGTNGSFFSWKGLLGSAVRNSVASVKARPSQSKGQMEVITVTKSGIFQLWDISWSGQHIFKKEVDVHSEVVAALQGAPPPESRGESDLHVLDFAILQQHQVSDSQVAVASDLQNVHLLALVALFGPNHIEYSLVEIDLARNPGIVSRAIPLRNFHQTHVPKEPKGILLLPHPGHTALVQFNNAIVVASLAEPEEGPDTQFLSDSGKPPFPYQDTIYFREDRNVQICGSALEQAGRKDKQSSTIFFIQGFGIIQISVPPPATEDTPIGRHKVTALDKLTQATFFSSLPDNIIDFSVKSRYSFSPEEVEDAAQQISSGILTSSFEFIQKVSSSMEDQIRRRRGALRNLGQHLRSDYPALSFQTKWNLLWDAEKLAAALQLWIWYEERCQKQRKNHKTLDEKPLLADIITMLNERYKTQIRQDLGETDPVRQYFLRDINRLEIILPWAWNILRMNYAVGVKEHVEILPKLSEADDILLVVFETVSEFRKEHMKDYGLDADSLENGVLKADMGYDAFPEPGPWTSTHNIVHATKQLVNLGRELAIENFENGDVEDIAQKVAKENPRLVKICCQTHIERIRWASEQSEERLMELGRALQKEYDTNVRPHLIYGLLQLGLSEKGMDLAESYRDMPTLARLIWDEMKYLMETKEAAEHKIERTECDVKLKKLKERIQGYFTRYGDEFADAYYTRHIEDRQSGRLFGSEHLNQTALTNFFRTDPSRGKLAWINDVCGEQDFGAAAKILLDVARLQETNSWCKKVELSIAKLALLCDADDEQQIPEMIQEEMEVSKIQQNVEKMLSETVTAALDDESALELAMDEFGKGRLARRPALQTLLRSGFEEIINHRVLDPATLVDVLTLIQYDIDAYEKPPLLAHQYAMALEILADKWDDMDKPTRESAANLIWKRLYIRDDWATINDTEGLSDRELQEKIGGTFLGWTLQFVYNHLLNGQTDQKFAMLAPPAPSKVLGAGCTHEEYAKRFNHEDLRNPIIQDNLSDDGLLQENIEHHRLDMWVTATKQLTQAHARHQRKKASKAVQENSDARRREQQAAAVAASQGPEAADNEQSSIAEEEGQPSEVTNEGSTGGYDDETQESTDKDVEMEDQ
ncbi:hypothetical protein GQ43DRAFT_154756 [Delitschia confertaspora ATCC 74209]|uniref:Uncharacterized protein n=1 Tax=Delitschia confertaspora ATCC 74209 TaxID=1513339 RepID=A0A9P4MQ30_9PLEO|nr:hypothetical protein GQ43DRAFT_154756 [Delitschia confertaspora ATCC 74209]